MNEYERELNIRQPDDTSTNIIVKFTTSVDWLPPRKDNYTGPKHGTIDPLVQGVSDWVKQTFFPARRNSRYYTQPNTGIKSLEAGVFITIEGCPMLIVQQGMVSINGVKHSVTNATSIIARMFLKAMREKDASKLMLYLSRLAKVPENVTYALENRTPFTFWQDYGKHEVRLNVQLISDKEVAIEVSDGVWGTMSVKALDSFVNAHRNGSKRSRWAYISPRQLYIETVGKEPLDSEVKVMKSFLLQNRTSDLVENRARKLVQEIVERNPNRIRVTESEGFVTHMYIRGRNYDWMLTCSAKTNQSRGRQDVKTYVYSNDAEGEGTYRGPICIDNLGTNSSIGDQYVARALALLNDHVTTKMVNTISSYLPKFEIRDDDNGLPRMPK